MSLKDPRGESDKVNLRGLFGGGSRTGKGGGWKVLIGLVLVICAAVVAIVAADHWINSGRIYRGVKVGSVDVGGKTPAEARKILEKKRGTGALKRIKLDGPKKDYTFGAKEMGLNLNVAASVDRAYAVGRHGGFFAQIGQRVHATFGTVSVHPKLNYDPRVAQAKVENLANKLDQKPREASINISGDHVTVVPARKGYHVDTGATANSVDRAIANLTGNARIVGKTLSPQISTQAASKAADRARQAMNGTVVLKAQGHQWTLSPAEIGQDLYITKDGNDLLVRLSQAQLKNSLSDMYSTLTVKAVSADYTVNGTQVSVTPSRTGQAIQSKKLYNSMKTGIFQGDRTYDVPVATDKPKLTTAKAERLKPTALIGSYRTNYMTYSDDPGRVTNLQTAANAISGQLVPPGGVFSFNRLAEQYHYQPTKVIVNGKVTHADGGGLCQSSTTLYMAANYAGLQPIERHPHYAELPYIRPGFDATVWFGALDMKFKNTSPGYILLEESVNTQTGWVTAQIYGKPTGKHVQMWSKKVSVQNTDKGPIDKWITYKKVTQNGKVLFDGVLHEDTYKPLEG